MDKSTSPIRVDLEDLASRLKVLSDPTRLQIYNLLLEGVQCNSDLAARLEIPQNLVSYHLHALQHAGLLEVQRDSEDARRIYYQPDRAALRTLSEALGSFFDPGRIRPRGVGTDAQITSRTLVR